MAQTKQEPLIKVRDLLIEFGTGRRKVKGVKGATFDVRTGETLGLVGESGSGKTTTARAIMGMQPITDGTVYFDGKVARGKVPNFFKLSKAIGQNLDILIENQISITLKMDEYIEEYKRVYYKYMESKFYVLKTSEVRMYEDGVNRKIPEGVNLKDTKIVTSDKQNNLKQILSLTTDSLKRLVKIARLIQKTTKFAAKLSAYIDIDPELDRTISRYLHSSKEKVLQIKSYENKIYLALKGIQTQRRKVLDGELTSISNFFDELGYSIKQMIANHKAMSPYVKSLRKDVKMLEALTSPKNKRNHYMKEILKSMDEIQEIVSPKNHALLEEYHRVEELLKLKNINEAIHESPHFQNPTNHQRRELKREMQMIFQDPSSSLNDRMSVEEIIGEGLDNFPQLYKNDTVRQEYVDWYNLNCPKNECLTLKEVKDRDVKHYLILQQVESVGLLPEHLSRYPHEFSGGQRQRIGIARALIMRPRFIVADEPISALDVSIRAQVMNLLNKFQKEYDLTYIFIAHDLSVVRHIADRIAVIYRGDIVELAPAEELFNNPLHPYTKSLLSAIPLADPDQERTKIHWVYHPEVEHEDYLIDFPIWQEVSRGHYIYANNREMQQYKKIVAEKAAAKKRAKARAKAKKLPKVARK